MDFKGFITWFKYVELRDLLKSIKADDSTFNKIHHLYLPIDLIGRLTENLEDSKISIVMDLNRIKEQIDNLIKEILALGGDK